MAKSRNKSANITAQIYDGAVDISYDCTASGRCAYTLCEVMPPPEGDECAFKQYGSCRARAPQEESLKSLRNAITAELKRLEEEEENA